MKRSLVQKLLTAAESPYFELPKAWHVLTRYRTAELFLRHPPPAKVRFADDDLYRRLVCENNEVQQEPLRINSSQPALVGKVLNEQWTHMNNRLRELQQQDARKRRKQQHKQQQSQSHLPHRPTKADIKAHRNLAYQQSTQQIQEQLQSTRDQKHSVGYLEFIQDQEERTLQEALLRLKHQGAASKKP